MQISMCLCFSLGSQNKCAVSSVMEKREIFVHAVSKELIGEFLQFIQLDVSFRFSFIVILTVNVKRFSKIMSINEI